MMLRDKIRVNSGFGDPVEGNVNLATCRGNVFYGYYGYGRDNGESKHRGFDYAVNKGTGVVAVGFGKIVQVRIGPKYKTCYAYDKDRKEYIQDKELFECPLLKLIKSNVFSDEKCESCPGKNKYQQISKKTDNSPAKYKAIHDLCYGVQVWLKLDNTDLYAYYAHLSALSTNVKDLIDKFLKKGSTTAKFEDKYFKEGDENDPRIVQKGDPIGNSGRTGVASGKSWPDHLHFECRKGNVETNYQISPNNIVNTQFIVMIGQKPVFEEANDTTVWSKIESKLQKDWKSLFSNIGKIEKYNYSENTVYYSPKKALPFDVHPCDEIIDVYQLEVVSNNGNKSIDPYQIVKKSKESYRTGRGMTCVYESEEDIIE